MPYANNKGSDQPAHPRSLISAFVVRYLDSKIPLLATAKISKPYQVSVAEQVGLSHTWPKPPKTGFLVVCPFIHVCVCVCIPMFGLFRFSGYEL